MHDDMIRFDAPATKEELSLLRKLRPGDVREGPLFPALPVPVVWACTLATEAKWEFVGMFCGELVMTIVVEDLGSMLTLSRKETVSTSV